MNLPILMEEAIFAKLVVFICPFCPAVCPEGCLRDGVRRRRDELLVAPGLPLFLFVIAEVPDGVPPKSTRSRVSSSSSSVSEEMRERMLLLVLRRDLVVVDLVVPGVFRVGV